jgi:hypothetical protein
MIDITRISFESFYTIRALAPSWVTLRLNSTCDEKSRNHDYRDDDKQASHDREHPRPMFSPRLRGRTEILLQRWDIIRRRAPCPFAAQTGVALRCGKISFWNSVYFPYQGTAIVDAHAQRVVIEFPITCRTYFHFSTRALMIGSDRNHDDVEDYYTAVQHCGQTAGGDPDPSELLSSDSLRLLLYL